MSYIITYYWNGFDGPYVKDIFGPYETEEEVVVAYFNHVQKVKRQRDAYIKQKADKVPHPILPDCHINDICIQSNDFHELNEEKWFKCVCEQFPEIVREVDEDDSRFLDALDKVTEKFRDMLKNLDD